MFTILEQVVCGSAKGHDPCPCGCDIIAVRGVPDERGVVGE